MDVLTLYESGRHQFILGGGILCASALAGTILLLLVGGHTGHTA